MHCTGAADQIPPMIDHLLSLPIIDDLAGPHDTSGSDPLHSQLPDSAPALSRLASIRPNRLEWSCRPSNPRCEASLAIISSLKPLLQAMQARIEDLIPRPLAGNPG